MSTTALPLERWSSLRPALPALIAGVLLLGLVFRQEAAAAIDVWSTSTAYNHCFLVLPIVAWLVYERRAWLPGVPVQPIPAVALAALPCAAMWLVAERLGIMEGRQLMALACLELLFLAVLGWRLAWLLSAPLLYLVFLVPFGSFLTPALQDFTASFIVHGLDLFGIANISDGNTIEIPEGIFLVAEACAGLRFLIASIAFGVLYALTFYRSPVRRAAFVAASIAVPIVANGMRALGIVTAGHLIGSAQAAVADHIIYGWLFFSFVTMILILAGLPFRQDGPTSPRDASPPLAPRAGAPDWHPTAMSLALPVVLMVIAAAAGPLLASSLDRSAARTVIAAPDTIAGCTALGDAAAVPSVASAQAGASSRAFGCADGMVTVIVTAFPPRTNPTIILATQRSLAGPDDAEDTEYGRIPGAPGWQAVTTVNPVSTAATALWLDGSLVSGGLRSRIEQARNSIAGLGRPPVIAVARASAHGLISGQQATLAAYLASPGGAALSARLADFSATPASPTASPTQ